MKELSRPTETLTYIPHNLPFIPAFVTYGKTSGLLNMPRQNIFVDKTYIYWSHPGNGGILDDTFIIVFNVDIETSFLAPKVNLSTSSDAGSKSDVGIRFTKPTKDISSNDLRDYILHSSARSPMLHAVVPFTADSSGKFSYTHDLPYNPIFFALAQTALSGNGTPYVLLNNFASLTTSGKTISVRSLLAGAKGSFIILKDPFDIDNNLITVNL